MVSKFICTSVLLCLEDAVFLLCTSCDSYNFFLLHHLHRCLSLEGRSLIEIPHFDIHMLRSLIAHCLVLGLYVNYCLLKEDSGEYGSKKAGRCGARAVTKNLIFETTFME